MIEMYLALAVVIVITCIGLNKLESNETKKRSTIKFYGRYN